MLKLKCIDEKNVKTFNLLFFFVLKFSKIVFTFCCGLLYYYSDVTSFRNASSSTLLLPPFS